MSAHYTNPPHKTSSSAIHFDQGTTNQISGNMLTILDNADASLQWGTGDFFVAIVGDYDNNPSNGQNLGVGNFFSKSLSPTSQGYTGVLFHGNVPTSTITPSLGLLFGTASVANDFVVSSTQYNNGNPHLFALWRRGAKIDLLVDGASAASSTSSGVDVSNAKTVVRIGADGDANLVRLDGDIGEIIAVKGALSQSDESGLASYLKTKWATP